MSAGWGLATTTKARVPALGVGIGAVAPGMFEELVNDHVPGVRWGELMTNVM